MFPLYLIYTYLSSSSSFSLTYSPYNLTSASVYTWPLSTQVALCTQHTTCHTGTWSALDRELQQMFE